MQKYKTSKRLSRIVAALVPSQETSEELIELIKEKGVLDEPDLFYKEKGHVCMTYLGLLWLRRHSNKKSSVSEEAIAGAKKIKQLKES